MVDGRAMQGEGAEGRTDIIFISLTGDRRAKASGEQQ
jgi:hypothetical protein